MFEWMVHPLAALALVFWASVLFGGRSREWPAVVWAAAGLVLARLLGAEWAVHPAAGMLLGFFGARSFHRWRTHGPALLAGWTAGVLFMALGAGWLLFPLSVMGVIWLLTAVLSGSRRVSGALQRSPAPLEQGGSLPGWNTRAERVAAGAARKKAGARKPPPSSAAPDLLSSFLRDERLPGEARAQLAALDLRTREALATLNHLGQSGSEAAYLARAIRDEYTPTAVQAYLKLPPTLANTAPLRDGKTGRDLLREQLDLLLNAVQDLLEVALRTSGQELLTHQRFLEDRFRAVKDELKV
ncbi:hypothetical protein [Deinococcus sp. YIM 77859]|uniref:hypothetical protein n=1 Tax=Deinococcus sp. YIM 77859 TaxID=1540221 RepID=UPI000553A654|nr:hypothetical protein [Deinococcus sp. YIM 77859]